SRVWPGRPFHSLHFVSAATCCDAPTASHSDGATTPTRLPLTTTCALGYRALFSSPTELRVEPSVLGCTTRPCSMFGRRTSVTQTSLALTLDGVTVFAYDLPIIVYSLVGFNGGFPVTVNPKTLVRSPVTGMVSFSCCPATSSP